MNYENYGFTKDDTLIAKGVAIILMYIHHLFYFDDRITGGNYYNSMGNLWGAKAEIFFGSFGKLCVCMFIFLSGYATYKTFISKGRSFQFINHKIIKFYKLYLIVFAIFVPMGYFLKKLNFGIYEFVNNLLLLKSSYNWEWWFARPFIVLMFLFPIVIRAFEKTDNRSDNKKNKDVLAIDVIKIICTAIVVTTILPYILKIDFFEPFRKTQYYTILVETLGLLPGFLSGYVFAKYDLFEKYNALLKNNLVNTIVSIFAVVAVFDLRCKTGVDMDYDYLYVPIFIISCTSLINRVSYIKSVAVSIGRLSTYMWLIHTFFCYYYFQSFIFLSHNPIIIVCWLLIVTYSASFVIDKSVKLAERTVKNGLKEKSLVTSFTNML
ncbi:MAG: acyltransferase [Clostridium sp.]|nr:acyltransferase [Clostridium sp.]